MKEKYKNKNVIGVDESGVGDYFTPLVGTAIYLTYEQALELERIGVKDSKLLSKQQIAFFAKKIIQLNQHAYHFLSTSGYNKLNKYFNAHELKTLIHLTTINKLLNKYKKVDEIIVDKYVEENKWHEYEEHLNTSMLKIPKVAKKIVFINQGEKEHIAVAAASILARNYMMTKMKYKNEKWNLEFPLGINEKVINFGIKFVKEHGAAKLYEVAKIKFKTTNKILNKE